MVTRAEREHREAGHLFRQLMDSAVTHVRVGQGRQDGARVRLIGHARDLHGLDGVCTCCPRRTPEQAAARAELIAAARRAAADSAEAGPRFAGPRYVDDQLRP